MANRIVYFNGDFIPESEARVSIFDSALMFGDMAFEMTRTYKHNSFCLDEHLQRLYASLRLLEIDCGLSVDEMKQISMETLDRNLSTETDDVDWQIMHNVSRGPLPIYRTVFPQGLVPTVTVNCWPLVPLLGSMAEKIRSGVQLVVVSQQALPAQLIDAKAKTRSRMHYQMAILQAARTGDTWGVLLDPDGFLAEGPGWNLFIVREGILLTPEPRNILLGVSRATVIKLANQLGIEVCECNLGRYEALQADEIFCTSTPFSTIHVNRFEGQLVGDGTPGPIFTQLLNAWQEMVGVDFITQAQLYEDRLENWYQQEMQTAVT